MTPSSLPSPRESPADDCAEDRADWLSDEDGRQSAKIAKAQDHTKDKGGEHVGRERPDERSDNCIERGIHSLRLIRSRRETKGRRFSRFRMLWLSAKADSASLFAPARVAASAYCQRVRAKAFWV